MTALVEGTQALTRVDRDDAWQSGQLQREFADVLRDAGSLAETPLRLADVRSLLDRHLAGRPTRANFRTGTLTVCTMVPMRSVPHRVGRAEERRVGKEGVSTGTSRGGWDYS